MARTSSKITKTIPDSEEIMATYFTEQNESGDKYLITRNILMEFTLWECVEDGFKKIDTSYNPLDFDQKIRWKM